MTSHSSLSYVLSYPKQDGRPRPVISALTGADIGGRRGNLGDNIPSAQLLHRSQHSSKVLTVITPHSGLHAAYKPN